MKELLLLAVLTATTAAFTTPAFAEEVGTEVKKERKGKMAKFDKDGDKKISKSEYLDMQSARFSKIDSNGDGYLTREEMKSARKNAREKFREKKEKRAERKASQKATSEE